MHEFRNTAMQQNTVLMVCEGQCSGLSVNLSQQLIPPTWLIVKSGDFNIIEWKECS